MLREGKDGSLVVVGFGIKFLSHLTTETKTYITNADKVLYLVNEPAAKEWIQKYSKSSESLDALYQQYSLRRESYNAIAEYVLHNVRNSQHICAVFYGHPAVFADPGIKAVIQARKEGFDARMLPAISAEDCLFADLLINPGSCGCQSYEATDFLAYQRSYNTDSHLILWQVGFIGTIGHLKDYDNIKGIGLLLKYLSQHYPLDHKAILYEAAQYPHLQPRIADIRLGQLAEAGLTPITTLYIPPLKKNQPKSNVLKELGIQPSSSG